MADFLGLLPSDVMRHLGSAFQSLMPAPDRPDEVPDHVAGRGQILPALVMGHDAPTLQPRAASAGPFFGPGGSLRPTGGGGLSLGPAPRATTLGPVGGYLARDPMGIFAGLAAEETAHQKIRAQNRIPDTTTGGSSGSSGPSTGMTPGVAKWAEQTSRVFGDLGADIPDVMLAIMTNESGGDPNALNTGVEGGAWGLFQNVGLGSRDPDTQFRAARELAQQKLASIAQSYAANGLHPDQRTRALDLALAWAGHFDYDTGKRNPHSADIASGQNADELARIFLKNYDAIKNGRNVAPTGSVDSKGLATIWGGSGSRPISQEFGETDFSQGNPIYDYGSSYGVSGHTGIDIAMDAGSQVWLPVGGKVVTAGGTKYYRNEDENPSGVSNPGEGELRIELDNGDIVILGHMRRIGLQAGQRVNTGDFAGLSGSANGGHVHLEVRKVDHSLPSGYRIVDPTIYFGGGG